MKNKKGRVYATVLLACICIAAVAAVFSIVGRSRNSLNNSQNEVAQNDNVEEELQNVIINKSPSYMESESGDSDYSLDIQQSVEQEDTKDVEVALNETKKEETEDKNEKDEEEPVFSQETDSYTQTGVFEDDMLFKMPVEGNIVMDYSIDSAIYDVTLDQYRTNDNIAIAANVGDEVKAAAGGVVEKVYNDDERGETVVINHNNGWKTTYSQLTSDVAVLEGDSVKEGQVIGSVSEPTKYGVELGSHINFSVFKDDQLVDPKIVMAE